VSVVHPAITVEDLGKRYRIGRVMERHSTLRDMIAHGARRGMQAVLRPSARAVAAHNHIWALRDLNFDVVRGEAIGIIGANGAGKSTLLKVLSRITEPTTGEVRIRGRVGSLLEVGTGFHSELTGRENTYLNGAILGMRRTEIDAKFDEIVAFAEVDRFIDTPVKHYSTGMYLRLAFAVAAHLEPDVLIVDEVLAVGDAEFQRKCLGKMQDVTQRDGRTVFFVSHNMSAVQRLCSRCLLLQQGRLVADGPPKELVPLYLASGTTESMPETWLPLDAVLRRGNSACRFTRVRYTSGTADTAYAPYTGGPLQVRVGIDAAVSTEVGSLAVTLYDVNGAKLVNADSLVFDRRLRLEHGTHDVLVDIDELHLNPGTYRLGLWLADAAGAVCDFIESAVDVVVVAPAGAASRRPVADGAVPCTFELHVLRAGQHSGDATRG
jgi:lipopolysaccharide transport system ATP-binding protein